MTNLIKMRAARPPEAKRLEFRVDSLENLYLLSLCVDDKCLPFSVFDPDCTYHAFDREELLIVALAVLNLGQRVYTSGYDTLTYLIAEGNDGIVLSTHVSFSKRWCDGQFAPSHIEVSMPVPEHRWLVSCATFAEALTDFYETLKRVVGEDKLPEIFDPNINFRYMCALPGYPKENV